MPERIGRAQILGARTGPGGCSVEVPGLDRQAVDIMAFQRNTVEGSWQSPGVCVTHDRRSRHLLPTHFKRCPRQLYLQRRHADLAPVVDHIAVLVHQHAVAAASRCQLAALQRHCRIG
ncbi:hypothetical protein D3C84_780660 [compost metagenome]